MFGMQQGVRLRTQPEASRGKQQIMLDTQTGGALRGDAQELTGGRGRG